MSHVEMAEWVLVPVLVIYAICYPASGIVNSAPCLPDQACTAGLNVRFGNRHVQCDENLKKSLVKLAPNLSIDVVDEDRVPTQLPGQLLVLLVDADAPSADACPDEYWLHWIAEAQPQYDYSKIRRQLVGYYPPSPPPGSGRHRYQLLLYPLEGGVDSDLIPKSRSVFDLDDFTSDAGLDDPISTFQFIVSGG